MNQTAESKKRVAQWLQSIQPLKRGRQRGWIIALKARELILQQREQKVKP
jgi:hypothetical protein